MGGLIGGISGGVFDAFKSETSSGRDARKRSDSQPCFLTPVSTKKNADLDQPGQPRAEAVAIVHSMITVYGVSSNKSTKRLSLVGVVVGFAGLAILNSPNAGATPQLFSVEKISENASIVGTQIWEVRFQVVVPTFDQWYDTGIPMTLESYAAPYDLGAQYTMRNVDMRVVNRTTGKTIRTSSQNTAGCMFKLGPCVSLYLPDDAGHPFDLLGFLQVRVVTDPIGGATIEKAFGVSRTVERFSRRGWTSEQSEQFDRAIQESQQLISRIRKRGVGDSGSQARSSVQSDRSSIRAGGYKLSLVSCKYDTQPPSKVVCQYDITAIEGDSAITGVTNTAWYRRGEEEVAVGADDMSLRNGNGWAMLFPITKGVPIRATSVFRIPPGVTTFTHLSLGVTENAYREGLQGLLHNVPVSR